MLSPFITNLKMFITKVVHKNNDNMYKKQHFNIFSLKENGHLKALLLGTMNVY